MTQQLERLNVSVPPGDTLAAPAPQPLHESHGQPPRGSATRLSSRLYQGRYGRLFRSIPVRPPSPQSLTQLAGLMIGPDTGESPIDSGYTYLGQFIDHDITFDPVSSLQRQNDPDALVNFRTPRLDLDSLYGRGPADDPFLYANDGLHLRLGKKIGPLEACDLPRDRREEDGGEGPNRALIGDPRNDENKIVAQLHVVFMMFHNAVVDRLATQGLSDETLFKEAQRHVRWHYQWLVLHDFLPTILGASGKQVVEDMFDTVKYRTVPDTVGGSTERSIRTLNLAFYKPHSDPFMPFEFSAAAYRFGHSMVRGSYRLNDDEFPGQPVRLFNDGPTFTNLNGFGDIPAEWGIRWKHFFGAAAQKAMRIDATLTEPLANLPGPPAEHLTRSLAERNLLRGLRLDLPSGENVARAMGIAPLTAEQLTPTAGPMPAELIGNTPLWYYVLKEAEVCAGGGSLGPVGGRIVAEVLVGLVAMDPMSYLQVEPDWTPELGATGDFAVADLLREAKAMVD